MKITALVENCAPENLESEHGLSLYIEYRGRRYLLDTGAHGAFLRNALKLGVSLESVDTAIVSHDHYDHIGGMDDFFSVNHKAKVYIRKEAQSGQYYAEDGDSARYIGQRKGIFEEFPDRFQFVEGKVPLDPGVWLVPDGEEDPRYSGHSRNLLEELDGKLVPDRYFHEQSLVMENGDSLVLFNSCSHRGIANITANALREFPGKRVTHVFGGFHMMRTDQANGTHLMNCTPEYVKSVCDRLIELGVEQVYTGHCTGLAAFEELKKNLGDRLYYFQTGDTAEI